MTEPQTNFHLYSIYSISFFLTVRWANFIEIFTTVIKLSTIDITEAGGWFTLTEVISAAGGVTSCPAGTYRKEGSK